MATKKREIQRRYGQTMTDAQYLALGNALSDYEEYLLDEVVNLYCKHCACCDGNAGCEQLIDFRSTLIKGTM